MSEYIITDKQLKTATEAYSEHELSYPITAVLISGDKLPEVVRCRDCNHYQIVDETYDCDPIYGCGYFSLRNARIDDDVQEPQDQDGFCSWAERRGK